MVRKVRLESSRREPITLRSDGSIADFSVASDIIRLKLYLKHTTFAGLRRFCSEVNSETT